MVTHFGLEIDFETWRAIYQRYELCLQGCAQAATACYNNCQIIYPVPPNRNIEPAKACLESCHQWHTYTCLPHCNAVYNAELASAGRAPGGHGNPEPALNELKVAAKRAGYDVEYVNQVLLGAGALLIILSGGTAIAAGSLLILTGVTWGVLGVKLRQMADDPPSTAFTDIWHARRFEIDSFVPEPVRSSEAGQIFLPLVTNLLSAVSMAEAVAETLDRAVGAREANDVEGYFAQLRVSQAYARHFSEAQNRAHESRILAAEKLRGLTLDVSEDDLLFRLRAVANLQGLRLVDTEINGDELIIAYDDVVALLDRWRADGIDQSVRDDISRFALDERWTAEVVDTILTTRPHRVDYDQPVADILLRPEFTAPERALIEALESWGNFYVT